MVGPWPLAPHHDHLQYIHHVHLMQRGQNWGCDNLDCIFLSPKGGGDVEGRSPAKWRERWGAAPESTMTQKMKNTL